MNQSAMLASGAAWALHDLGMAAAFGGSLFGKVALNPAVREISSRQERGKVLNTAWGGYNIVNGISLATVAVTWLVGRLFLSGKEVDKASRGLVIAKDALIATTILTGAANIAGNVVMAKAAPQGAVPVEDGTTPSADTPEKVVAAQRVFKILGTVSLISMAGVIGVTALLATQSGKSTKWKLFSNLLP